MALADLLALAAELREGTPGTPGNSGGVPSHAPLKVADFCAIQGEGTPGTPGTPQIDNAERGKGAEGRAAAAEAEALAQEMAAPRPWQRITDPVAAMPYFRAEARRRLGAGQ